jgi:hypothetical protein
MFYLLVQSLLAQSEFFHRFLANLFCRESGFAVSDATVFIFLIFFSHIYFSTRLRHTSAAADFFQMIDRATIVIVRVGIVDRYEVHNLDRSVCSDRLLSNLFRIVIGTCDVVWRGHVTRARNRNNNSIFILFTCT